MKDHLLSEGLPLQSQLVQSAFDRRNWEEMQWQSHLWSPQTPKIAAGGRREGAGPGRGLMPCVRWYPPLRFHNDIRKVKVIDLDYLLYRLNYTM